MKMVGELDGGNLHVQFDEGVQETYVRRAMRVCVTRLCPTLPKPLAYSGSSERLERIAFQQIAIATCL